MNLVEQFQELVISLKKDDDIELIIFHHENGLPSEVLEKHPISFTKDITEIYTQFNGLQLVWIRKDNPLYDKTIHLKRDTPFPWLDMWIDDYPYDGSVMLLPLELSFNHDWENRIWYQMESKYNTSYLGKTMSVLDFKKQIIPFDAFSKYYSVSYYLGDPNDPFTLLLGQDYGADYFSSERFSLMKYIGLIIETKGEVKQRVESMKSSWGKLN